MGGKEPFRKQKNKRLTGINALNLTIVWLQDPGAVPFLKMATTTATSVVHIPTRTPQPNFGNLLIIVSCLQRALDEPGFHQTRLG